MNFEVKNLSYVLTTYNKLSYLKITLPQLLEACSEDEEIVVYDGGSTDGTKEYLEDYYRAGKIHQFVSERDHGEANGYNKAMLSARGKIIKIISDDDAYYYPGIKQSKEFMLEHPEVHLVAADGFGVNNLLQHNSFERRFTINDFQIWKQNKKPFIFCGLSILLRKDALPLLGLWDQNYIIIDFEYTLRVTAGNANIGWYTGLTYVNIVNQQSNSGKQWKRMEIEREKLERLYFDKSPLIPFQTKDKVKNIFRPIKYRLFPERPTNPQSYEQVFQQSMQLLKDENAKLKHEVLI